MDCILALQEREALHAPLPDNVDAVRTELVTAMRGACARHYGGENLRTLSMAVAFLDRALASRLGGDFLWRAELPGVLLMLAMKFADSHAPFPYMIAEEYGVAVEDVKETEMLVFQQLTMDVFVVTPYDFIEGLFLEIPAESGAVVLYGVLTALYLVPYRVYPPSVVAAAILAVALPEAAPDGAVFRFLESMDGRAPEVLGCVQRLVRGH